MQVIYPEAGFGSIIGQLLMQKLRDPKKIELAKKIRGEMMIEIRNLGAFATVRFMGDSIEVVNGKSENAKSVISANLEVINKLVFGAGFFEILKLIISGKLKIKGFGMAKKFSLLIR